MPTSEWWGYTVRANMTRPFLSGYGIEIGAGANPQRLPEGAYCRYFDKSDASHLQKQFSADIEYDVHPMEMIPGFFPNGADFLIAHNVLEHIHGEIAALRSWHEMVRKDGVFVISVPLRDHTSGDNMRLDASIDHLLDDYLMKRDHDTFEAREHSYSFCLGWDAGELKSWSHLNREEFVSYTLTQAFSEKMDIHWHALNRKQWDFVIQAAAWFGGHGVSVLNITDPHTDHEKTQGEVIYIYKLTDERMQQPLCDLTPHFNSARLRYEMAAAAI